MTHELPEDLAHGPFTRATALRHLTPAQLRHPRYRRLLRDVYLARSEITYEDRIAGALLVLPTGAVLRGRSAMWAHGVRLAGAEDAVEVTIPDGRRLRQRDGLRIFTERLAENEVVVTPLGLATTPARTVLDTARGPDPRVSVPLLDALVSATGVTREGVEAVASAHPGLQGIRHIGRALDLVDPGAESPRESLLRVVLVTSGCPAPVTQLTIVNGAGEFVARVDLGWPRIKVAVEYDGAYHDDPRRVARDRARLNALRAAGWTVFVIDRAQLARPDDVVAMLRPVLQRR